MLMRQSKLLFVVACASTPIRNFLMNVSAEERRTCFK